MLEVEVCNSASCKKKGGTGVKAEFEDYLKAKGYDYVAREAKCSGNCSSGPVVRVNGEIFKGSETSFEEMVEKGLKAKVKIEGRYRRSSGRKVGVSIDLGTTVIDAQLLDLETGKVYGRAKTLNKQKHYGVTVTERLNCLRDGGMEKLNGMVNKCVGALVDELLGKTGTECFEKAAVAGNTIMSYIFLGEDPKIYEKNKPNYREVKRRAGNYVVAPCVSEFIGGDTVTGMLSLSFDKFKKNAMLIDLGTNGEVALTSKDYKVIVAASASAGPAFEGGGFKCGMPALEGAIYEFSLKKGHKTVNNKKPEGICGTGMLDVIYELFSNKIINPKGSLESGWKETKRGKEYFITEEISISEPEIKYFIDSKAAIFATVQTLLKSLEMSLKELEVIYVAGGFGKMDFEKAAAIGLLPIFSNYKYAGNTSLKGAKMCLKEKNLERAEGVAKQTTTLDLVGSKEFYENYMAARFLPHTNAKLFK